MDDEKPGLGDVIDLAVWRRKLAQRADHDVDGMATVEDVAALEFGPVPDATAILGDSFRLREDYEIAANLAGNILLKSKADLVAICGPYMAEEDKATLTTMRETLDLGERILRSFSAQMRTAQLRLLSACATVAE